MHKVSELDINILKNSKNFNDIIILFHKTLVEVNEKETNTALVIFFSYLISSRTAQDIVNQYLDYITIALICSIPKEKGTLLEKLSNALIILMNNAESQGTLDTLKQFITQALYKDSFNGVNERVK